jgi:GNAT superfamily N-acetyltransferase
MKVRVKKLCKKDCALLAKHIGYGEREYLGHFQEQKEGKGIFLVAWHRAVPVGRLWLRWRDGHVLRRLRNQYVPRCRKKDEKRRPEFERGVLLKPTRRAIRKVRSLKDSSTYGDIIVKKGCRGKGVGTQLIRSAERRILAKGLARASIDANVRGRARQLYERLGYMDPGLGAIHTYGIYIDDRTGRQRKWDNGKSVLLVKHLRR